MGENELEAARLPRIVAAAAEASANATQALVTAKAQHRIAKEAWEEVKKQQILANSAKKDVQEADLGAGVTDPLDTDDNNKVITEKTMIENGAPNTADIFIPLTAEPEAAQSEQDALEASEEAEAAVGDAEDAVANARKAVGKASNKEEE